MHVAKPRLVDDPAALEQVDAVLFAVKLWDTESAAAAVRPLVAKGAVVVPFQNGVESIERIGAVVGAPAVMGGVAYIAATIAEPGVIAHTGTMARLRFGPVVDAQRGVAEALFAACQGAGIDAELSADIRRAIWEKFAFLASFSGLTSVSRQPIGVLRTDPDSRAALEAAIREVWTVGARPRRRARRRFRRAADEIRRWASGGDEVVDAERSRRGQSARSAVALRRRRADGRGGRPRGPRQLDALCRVEAVLQRDGSLILVIGPGESAHAPPDRLAHQRGGVARASVCLHRCEGRFVRRRAHRRTRPRIDQHADPAAAHPADAAGDAVDARPLHLRDQRLLFWWVGSFVEGFHVSGFWSAVFGAIVYSLISWLLSSLLPRKQV
jgi:2-dehydropantoate 2-reductase